MVQELNARGICGTCIYRSNCLSQKNSMKEGTPVLYCEEFDVSASKTDGRSKPEEGERRFLSNSFGTVRCFSIKNLIPGWE